MKGEAMFQWLIDFFEELYKQTAPENHWPNIRTYEMQYLPTKEIQDRIKENKKILREVRKSKDKYQEFAPKYVMRDIKKLEKIITKSNSMLGRLIKERILKDEE